MVPPRHPKKPAPAAVEQTPDIVAKKTSSSKIEKPLQVKRRIPTDQQFLIAKAKPQLDALKLQIAEEDAARPKPLSRKVIVRTLRQTAKDAGQLEIDQQRLDERADAIVVEQQAVERARLKSISERKAAIMEEVRASSTAELEDLARQRKPEKARGVIPSETAFLQAMAEPILAEAALRGEHVSKSKLYKELRVEHSAKLQEFAEQREALKLKKKADKGAVAHQLAPSVPDSLPLADEQPVLTRAQLRKREAAAARAAAEANAEPKPRKPSERIPSPDQVVRSWAIAIVADARKRDEFITVAAVERRLRVERADELAELEQRRQAAAERERLQHQERLARPRETVRVRRHSFEVIEHHAPKAEKKTDKRRQRREQRRQEEEAAAAVKLPKLGEARDYISAAEAHMKRGEQAMAGRLLFKAADQLGINDPERLKVAAVMQKAKGPDMAARVLQPMVDADGSNAGPALAFMSTLRLARGGSRTAFDVLARHDREELKPLKAAAQLSLAIRTGDDSACDDALSKLTKARFSNRGQALTVDLSAYPGLPEQVRLAAATPRYASTLGEALVRADRLYEAVGIYDSLSPVQPSCAGERRDFIHALKSAGTAYYRYGVANRQALGEMSVPSTQAPTEAWSTKEERIRYSETADKYLGLSVKRLFQAFRLDGTDEALRHQLVDALALKRDADGFEALNQRVHRRAKKTEKLEKLPDREQIIAQLERMQREEELSATEKRLLRDLQRNRQMELKVERQRQELLGKVTASREETDKPAHRPTAGARSRRFYNGPQR